MDNYTIVAHLSLVDLEEQAVSSESDSQGRSSDAQFVHLFVVTLLLPALHERHMSVTLLGDVIKAVA